MRRTANGPREPLYEYHALDHRMSPSNGVTALVRLVLSPLRILYRLLGAVVGVITGLLKFALTVAFVALVAFAFLQIAGVGADLGPPGGESLPSPLGETEERAPGDPGVTVYEPSEESVNSSAVERLVHEEVNDRRTEHDLDRIAWDSTVASVSRAHSRDMADRDYFSHTNPEGEGPYDRYRAVDRGCRGYGENIAMTWAGRPVDTGDGDAETYVTEEEIAESLVEQWMNSQGHRENILRPEWDSGGVGVYATDDGQLFATHNFCHEWGL